MFASGAGGRIRDLGFPRISSGAQSRLRPYRAGQALRHTPPPGKAEKISRMKGHEDGGYVLWNGGSTSGDLSPALSAEILRKEVIQPQVPLRLPCYDFTPVAKPTVVACLLLRG